MRSIRMVAVSLALAAACSGGPGARIERTGWSRDGEVLGIAGIVRVDRPVRDVTLVVALDGKDTETDTLPFCVPDTACWWGVTFQHRAEQVRVEVKSTGKSYEGHERPRELRVRRIDATHLRVASPRRGGTVYVIGLVRDDARWGLSYTVDDTDRRARSVRIAGVTRARAVFYPGAVGRPAD